MPRGNRAFSFLSKMMPADHWVYPWIALATGLVMIARVAVTVGVFSQTIDEPCHVGAAVSMVEAHKLVALVSHPPLSRWVAVVPLWIDGARLPQCRGQKMVRKEDVGYSLGTQVLFNSPTPYRTLLIHARLAMLVFPMIALLYVYLLGTWMANRLTGLLAAAFFSTDPTLLGHAFWIGTDAASCAMFLAAFYHGLRWIRGPAMLPAAIAGVALGLAAATKFSCIIVVFALAAIVILDLVGKEPLAWKRLLPQAGLILVVAFVTLWATYQFDIGPMGNQDVLGRGPEWQRVPALVRNTPVPMPSFFLGLARLAAHSRMIGHTAYLNGEVRYKGGWWYYFPEVLVLKSPVAMLIALAGGFIFAIQSRRFAWQSRAVLTGASVFLFFSMIGKIDIGIRHILPVIPLLYLFAAMHWNRPKWVWGLIALIAMAYIETAAVHPDYLSFFNLAAGGPARGERYAIDSNLDWGQDIFRLADWVRANAKGSDYALRLCGQRQKPLLKVIGLNPDALDESPHGKLLFIDKNTRLLEQRLPWLSNHQPMAHIGYSIDVYDLRDDHLAGEPDDVPAIDDPDLIKRR